MSRMGRRLVTDEQRKASVDRWFRLHSDRVLAFLLHRADRETALDVLQEVYLLAFRKADKVPEQALGWLFAAARRLLANAQRGHRRRDYLLQRLRQEPQPMAAADHGDEDDTAICCALVALSVRDREVLTLSAWYGLNSAEAAQALGCTTGAYDVRLHRARQRLADRMQPGPTTSGEQPPTQHEGTERSHACR